MNPNVDPVEEQRPVATTGPETAAEAPDVAEEGDGFRLHMSKDRMQISLDCDTLGRELGPLADAVMERLTRFGIPRPPSIDVLRDTIAARAAENSLLAGAALLTGTPPIPPVDGRIEWGDDFFNTGFEIDEATGRVNFRRRLGKCNVAQGQLLATVSEPVKGRNGIDLMGNPIRVPQPRRARIRAGEQVEVGEGGLQYFATCTGRVRWAREVLSVDSVYEIEGNVGLETGDISHDGAVVVRGDILDGSRVHALGDVEVMGVVEGAHLQSGGSLHVHGGISGSPVSRIVVAGGVHARFLLDAHIQAGGDVSVESEIVHCTITTRGAIFVPGGRLVGGEVNALGGVDAGQVGSPASVPTVVIAGEDHALEGRIVILKSKIRMAQENVDKIHNTLAPLRGKIAQLPEKSREALKTLVERLPAMEAAVEELKTELGEVQDESRHLARPVILIRARLYPEVRLRIHGETLHVREEVVGPLRPIVVQGRIRLASTHMRQIAQPLDPVTEFLAHEESN